MVFMPPSVVVHEEAGRRGLRHGTHSAAAVARSHSAVHQSILVVVYLGSMLEQEGNSAYILAEVDSLDHHSRHVEVEGLEEVLAMLCPVEE